ncbi:MAG: alpha/beta hydrolase [Halobacteriovoraceae bacterium]|nr:alpha/beta hydrolase [Halobacteriovoraceae bacterium]
MDVISHYIPTSGRNLLHLREFSNTGKSQGAILFVHGSIEDGRIFYSKKGKGLAPFLANKGFRCFVLDLRARGKSHPPLEENYDFNQSDMLKNDFPKIFEFILGNSEGDFSLVSHSWGGVLINSFLLRKPEWIPKIKAMVHVSVKRRVTVFNLHRLFYIDFMWNLVGTVLLRTKGFLPKGWFGPEGESNGTLKDTQEWVYSREWEDKKEGINYNQLSKSHTLPPALYLTGKADWCLGHIQDVSLFAEESGHSKDSISLLGKETGYKMDYDHINILTSKLAEEEHFPKICHFLTKPV